MSEQIISPNTGQRLPATYYTCAKCGGPADPHRDVARPCGHDDAPIIANISAVAHGESDSMAGDTK